MKKILALLVTATVLGAGGVTVASAAAPSTATTKPAAKSAGSSVRGAVGATIRKLAFATAANTIGISPADLLKDMKGGHSVADVAQAHNVEASKVVSDVVAAIDARIQQAVTNHKITSDQATRLEKIVATRVPKLVNATPKQIARRAIRQGAIDVASKTIGITPIALRQAFMQKQTVAQVATAHSVDPKTVVAALVTAGDKRVDEMVGNQHLAPARAARLKARVPTAAQRFVDRARGVKKAAAAA